MCVCVGGGGEVKSLPYMGMAAILFVCQAVSKNIFENGGGTTTCIRTLKAEKGCLT